MISVFLASVALHLGGAVHFHQDTTSLTGVRTPAYAPDGRLALSLGGHLMLQRSAGAPLIPLTSGAGWDRDPAWTPDGGAIVFASDRSGNYDLWRLVVNTDGTAGALTQLTKTSQQETSPSVSGDGRVAFLRGSGNATRVWVLDAAGKETRLTTGRSMKCVLMRKNLAWS